ncbi:MAG: hypothetical protein HYV04_01560 [Deltaproteobacteria bacterium]|nr:hypothetical protein [Deltaproteobacteria bacterium]
MTETTVTAPTRLSTVPKLWQTVCCYESGVLDRGAAPDVRARAPNLPGAPMTGRPDSSAVERTAGSHTLAAAVHHDVRPLDLVLLTKE